MAGTEHLEVGRDDPFLEGGGGDGDLEGGPRRVEPLDGPVEQRAQPVGGERRVAGPVDAGRERVRIVGGKAGEGEDLAVVRIEHDGGAGVAERPERLLRRLLQVVVDREPHAAAGRRRHLLERADLAAEAVDDHPLGAVLAHQQVVVAALEARLPHHVSRLEARGGHLRLAGGADVADQVRGQQVRGVPPRRHPLDDDVGQLGVEPVREHGAHLLERGVLDDRHRAVARAGCGRAGTSTRSRPRRRRSRGTACGWSARRPGCARGGWRC